MHPLVGVLSGFTLWYPTIGHIRLIVRRRPFSAFRVLLLEWCKSRDGRGGNLIIRKRVTTPIVILTVVAMAADGRAQSYPHLDVAVTAEVQNDFTFDSDDPGVERNDTFTKTEPALTLHFSRGLYMQAGIVLEPMLDPEPGKDRFFEDQGLFAETWTINFETERMHVFAGKFNPGFALGYNLAPGIYGEDFPEEYEMTERIGFGGHVILGDESSGEVTLSASTFFADTSFLSGSALTHRGRLHEVDGGAGNTEDLSSFVVSVDAGNLPFLPGLSAHLAVRHQAAGKGDIDDETGFVAALYGSFNVTDQIAWVPFVELVYLGDADDAAEDRTYLTLSSTLLRGAWRADLSYSRRHIDYKLALMSDTIDHEFQATAGYEITEGVLVEAGYMFADEDDIQSHTLGVRLSYNFTFAIP